MKVLVGSNDMGGFPWLYPYEPQKDDLRRAVEVPEDLYERLMDAHEEFCAVLTEVDVQCLEILDAPDPEPVRLAGGRGPDPTSEAADVWIARCAGATESGEGCRSAAHVRRDYWTKEDHARTLREILALGWRERRHGGLACPAHESTEVLLQARVRP